MKKVLHKVKSQWVVLSVISGMLIVLGTTGIQEVAAAATAMPEARFAAILSETDVDYTAVVSRGTDAINTAPWAVEGYQTIGISETYLGQTVEVQAEQVTDYGVTWAHIYQDGQEIGWIAKNALTVSGSSADYAHIIAETTVDYPATVSRATDAINTAPWATKGYQTIGSSADYFGQTVTVSLEQETDYGVTWALISQGSQEIGWVAKEALTAESYAHIVSDLFVDYPAIVSRGTDAINTAPWATKGYQTIGSSADYLGQTVSVSQEQATDYGVTWALISQDGQEIGWIAKEALSARERQAESLIVASEDTDSLILNGETLQLTASSAHDGTAAEVTWSVENGTGTATIDQTGLVRATSAGTVTVWVTAKDGSEAAASLALEIAAPLTITSYNGTDLDVVIPDVMAYGDYGDYSVEGLSEAGQKGMVTAIASKAFSGKQLTSVALPSSVKRIEEMAFSNNQLTDLVLPESLTSVGFAAFSSNQLSDVVIPEGVTILAPFAFAYNQLSNVVIPSSVADIGDSAFYDNQLSKVKVPFGVANIGDNAFGKNRLTEVVIPGSVKRIGVRAFASNQIASLVMAKGVTAIWDGAFAGNKLSKVVIPEGVESIRASAFSNNQLTDVQLPTTLKTIGYMAFAGNQLSSIVFPEGVSTISSNALQNNPTISITIGGGVAVGKNVVGGNDNFLTAYTASGAGTYNGTQEGHWVQISE